MVGSNINNNWEKLLLKIRDLKEKYSPQELKSILSHFENPMRKYIAGRLLGVED